MQSNNTERQLKPYHGLVVFAIVILTSIFVEAPIQRKWGIYGVAATEIILLLLGLIPAVILKADLKEVFPLKRPHLRQIIGTFVIWAGSYLTVTIITLIIGYFFPEGLMKVNNGLQKVFTSVPAGISFIIVAIMPAVCEEALHRGFILSSFYSLKNKALIVISMGIIFGIFHLDLYRFLPTAVLGMALTYIMVETKNMLLPALFHFINNGLAILSTFANESASAVVPESFYVPLNAIGADLILGAVIPFIILAGAELISTTEHRGNGRKRRKMLTAVLCSIAMAAAGIAIVGYSINRAPVFETSIIQHMNIIQRFM